MDLWRGLALRPFLFPFPSPRPHDCPAAGQESLHPHCRRSAHRSLLVAAAAAEAAAGHMPIGRHSPGELGAAAAAARAPLSRPGGGGDGGGGGDPSSAARGHEAGAVSP